jgi:hypothetical protein
MGTMNECIVSMDQELFFKPTRIASGCVSQSLFRGSAVASGNKLAAVLSTLLHKSGVLLFSPNFPLR